MIGKGRYLMYVHTFDTLERNWFLGIGYGSFSMEMQKNFGFDKIVHNIVLRVWVGAGISGLVALLAIVVFVLAKFIRLRRLETTARVVFSQVAALSFLFQFIMGLANPVLSRPFFFLSLGIFINSLSFIASEKRVSP